ncbi:hypothetical protein LWI28_015570 [Acer negundo]|uniref:Disease resistance N-terminal domain-containing protein n=1 Tax=Acer negundo TaxID=4023 RepID=A0AAD5NLU7_ACENE|nr:hypothetical protein LWI28_015570 [Acer negundo]
MVFIVEAVISTLLSASLQVLFDRLSPRTNLIEFFQRHKFDEILFENLETTLLQVNAVLSDAEEKQITNLSVRQWIDELKDAAYHTADLLDEIHSLALAESHASNSSALNKRVQKSKSKIEKMTRKLDNMAKHKDVLGLKEIFSEKPSPRLQLTSLVDETELSSLQELHVKNMQLLDSIQVGFYGNGSSDFVSFASLSILKFEDMPNWIHWSSLAVTGGGFPSLQELHIQKCENLIEIPNCLPSLELLFIDECWQFQFDDFIDYPALQTLHIESCNYPTNFTLNFFSQIKFLHIQNCRYLRFLEISEELHQELSLFWVLEISECPNMELFSGRGFPAPNLTTFSVLNCNNLRSMPEQMHTLLSSLQTLKISGCPKLVSFPDGGLPPSLQTLTIQNCVNLTPQNAWGLRNMSSLTRLIIECAYDNVTSFPDEGLLPASLTSLEISGFPMLKNLDLSGLQHLILLNDLHIECSRLQTLSDGMLPTSLSSLRISGSSSLTDLCRKDQGVYWDKISHIPNKVINSTEIH